MGDLKSKMLSGQQLKRAIPDSTIMAHKTVQRYINPRDLFNHRELPNVCFLFYENDSDPDGTIYGHWCLLIEYADSFLFFDPYGGSPQSQRELVNRTFHSYPYLIDLVEQRAELPLNWSKTQYQSKKEGVNTCGRHVLIRAIHQSKGNAEYREWMKAKCKKYKTDPDGVVTILSNQKWGF